MHVKVTRARNSLLQSLWCKGVATFSSGDETQIGVSSSHWSCKKYVLRDGDSRC